ncbi:MAG: arginine--tRNA ligase [Verrucomicrobiia bacterium]
MHQAPDILAAAVEDALRAVVGADQAGPAQIKPCADPKFGDYQANGIMPVAKRLKQNPRALAKQVVARLKVSDVSEPPTIAGAGFINFTLKPAFVAQQIAAAAADERLGVSTVVPQTVVIDFSSPNVAKPLHVGHIRSTIIGDCLARVRRFLGHHVITDNHIGDWGTQFGMLIVGWKKYRDEAALAADPITELERLYKLVNEQSERDAAVREEAKAELVKLQRGDSENRAIWQKIIDLSRHVFDAAYQRLDVSFDHTFGESFYNPLLPDVVADLQQRGIACESEGALCIFFKDDLELKKTSPLMVRKSDGGYGYGATDMATLKYRIEQWHPDEIIYVTDARQKLHFQQVFKAAAKWQPTMPRLAHVWFGSILGEDGKPLKTRDGTPVKLAALLDEAEERALAIVTEKSPELPLETRKDIARAVGIGAVKYTDLSQNRTTDYVFSWPKMLAMTGNTAPYMQYAYVRIRSIFRKSAIGGSRPTESRSINITLTHPAELDLAKHLLRFGEILQAVADDDKPNWLTGYLYELAGKFSVFYDNCPVLQSAEPLRSSRLSLCRLTADVMQRGLNLLGIAVIEQM